MLINWIKSQCQGIKDCKAAEIVLNELIEAKLIKESGNSITYEIERLHLDPAGSWADQAASAPHQ